MRDYLPPPPHSFYCLHLYRFKRIFIVYVKLNLGNILIRQDSIEQIFTKFRLKSQNQIRKVCAFFHEVTRLILTTILACLIFRWHISRVKPESDEESTRVISVVWGVDGNRGRQKKRLSGRIASF